MTVKSSEPCVCLVATVMFSRILIGGFVSSHNVIGLSYLVSAVTVSTPCLCRVSYIWLDEENVPCNDRDVF